MAHKYNVGDQFIKREIALRRIETIITVGQGVYEVYYEFAPLPHSTWSPIRTEKEIDDEWDQIVIVDPEPFGWQVLSIGRHHIPIDSIRNVQHGPEHSVIYFDVGELRLYGEDHLALCELLERHEVT